MRLIIHLVSCLIVMLPILHATPAIDTKSSYHLSSRDLIRITIFNEPDMTVDRRIDARGAVSLPLIGNVDLNHLTVSEAQDKIRLAYIEMEIFVHPQVSVTVTEYLLKEVSVIGQVKSPGKIVLPMESDELEIVDVISKAGGVTRLARSDSVRVTRKAANGVEQTFTVDVERMFNGRGGAKPFMVVPGDVIFVPERVL
jgi:protein involved in polysaccharide export with SLBB domain